MKITMLSLVAAVCSSIASILLTVAYTSFAMEQQAERELDIARRFQLRCDALGWYVIEHQGALICGSGSMRGLAKKS